MLEIILFCCVLEFLEALWQRGDNIKDIILYNYEAFHKSQVAYFLKHFGLIYILYITIALDVINTFTITILLMKITDIVFKLKLISNIDKEGKQYIDNFSHIYQQPLSNKLKYSGVIIYPTLLFFGFL